MLAPRQTKAQVDGCSSGARKDRALEHVTKGVDMWQRGAL